jgi:hypothetical protein
VFSLPFALVMAMSGLWALLWLPQALDGRLGWAAAILGALMCLALAGSVGWPALKALRERGPALVVDARGITDNFHLHAHLPWRVITSASVDLYKGGTLVLVLRPGSLLPGGEVVRARFWRRLFSGGDLSIPLRSLVYDHRRLTEALQAHLACRHASDEAR